MFKLQPFPPFPDSASRPQRHTGNRSPSPLEYADPDQGDYPDDEALPYQHCRYANNDLGDNAPQDNNDPYDYHEPGGGGGPPNDPDPGNGGGGRGGGPPILDPLVADLLEAHLVHQTHQTLPTILLSMKEAYNS